jgi:hypothetical protein
MPGEDRAQGEQCLFYVVTLTSGARFQIDTCATLRGRQARKVGIRLLERCGAIQTPAQVRGATAGQGVHVAANQRVGHRVLKAFRPAAQTATVEDCAQVAFARVMGVGHARSP